MKKTIILALALAAPAMAGDAKSAPITVVDVPPVVAPTPSPWALEIAGVHTWTMADANDGMHNINTWGVDVTAVYNMTPNWAATLRFSWADGSGRVFGDYGAEKFYNKLDITNWSVTAGVRYTAPITEKLSWFAGANAGWGRTEMTSKSYEDYGDQGGYSYKAEADDVGFVYSVETGLKYDICESLYVIGSVGFRGYWTTPNWDGGYRDDQQTGVSVSAGLGWEF
ncbi:MAG: outer membrane beta-barrel protein [Akkermansia sp.]|nr:outer membrane beta-barrel protein [Akkermansia sp.]